MEDTSFVVSVGILVPTALLITPLNIGSFALLDNFEILSYPFLNGSVIASDKDGPIR